MMHSKPEVYVGCSRWGRKDWIGKLYPPKTKEIDFLKLYGERFNSLELHALFYRMFPKSTIQNWANLVPDDFKFCPKMPSRITHIKRLVNTEEETKEMLEAYSGFGKKLGTAFMQFDEQFGPDKAQHLHRYLESLPRKFDLAVEFRHPDWFIESSVVDQTFSIMKELGVSTVITDTAGRRDALHMKLTTPKAFIRFVGENLHETDYKRIDDWADRIDEWLSSGLENVYFFIHQRDEFYTPDLAAYAIEQFNKKCGLNLQPLQLLKQNSNI